MIKMDLHLHSKYSQDAIGSPGNIIKILKKRGLDGAAFTDHNTSKGGLNALKFSSKDFLIITGIEISTSDGHMLALNIKEDIEKGLDVEETIERIKDLGGIPIVPHLYRTMSGIKIDKLDKIHKKIQVIEVFNACSTPKSNLKTAKTALKYNLGGTGGSDAHDPKYAGLAYTTIDTTDMSPDTILSQIKNKKTWGEGETMPLDYRRDRMLISIKQFFQRGLKKI